MTKIAVSPKVFKNYLLKVGADNYEAHVSEVSVTPSASIQTWKGAAPGESHSDVGEATWVCGLTYAQDWTTSNSLALYLLNNEGEQVDMEFSPLGAGPKFSLTVTITPGPIGGAIDSFGTASTSLPVQGKPEFAPGV